jgi:hypothetical protein
VTAWGFCVDRIETVSSGQASVTVQQVWTTDYNNNTKTSFRPGEQIRYKARINNSGTSTVSAAFVWEATGPRQIMGWSGNLDISAGTSTWDLDTTVPADAPAGNYTFRVRATYSGRTSEASSTFTVSGGPCLAESPHPYPNNYNNTWTLTNPDSNAASTRVHFSRIETESGWDYVYVRDANNNQINRFDGTRSDVWSSAVPGRAVKVQLTSDGSITAWGFCVDRIETVSGAQYSATWDSQSAYPTVSQGGRADLWVKYRNTGNTTWQRSSPNRTLLGTLHPDTGAIDYHSPFVCSSWIGDNRPAVLEESSVGPGGIGTFRFPICVPSNMAPGTYRLRVAPLVEGITWMLQSNVFWNVTVTPGGCPVYRAEYYNNRYLSGNPTFVQCEGWPIDHNWGNGGPGNGVGNDNFSARWTGRAHIDSGTYTFIGGADDGIRMWLDGNPIIDQWHDQGYTEYRETRSVSDGDHDIKVEYYENGGAARVYFRWEQQTGCSGSPISLNQTVGGTIGSSGQQHTYCLLVGGGQWISIRMVGNPGWTTNKPDPVLEVYDPGGVSRGYNDDGAFVTNPSSIWYRDSFLAVWLPSAGTYRIIARMYGLGTGPYAMRLEAGREAAPGDLNRDCTINGNDSSILMSRMGSSDPDADLILDGIVNSMDNSILQANWGRGCTAAATGPDQSKAPEIKEVPQEPSEPIEIQPSPVEPESEPTPLP